MKTVLDFQKMKARQERIAMITCYDYTSAILAANSNVDCILVGDSAAMTMHGHDTTVAADRQMMAYHTAAVRKGAPTKFIVADMPFLAHRGSLLNTMENVRHLMQAGAQAVKIEGVDGSEKTIAHIVQSGVPVMGHLGLTPQSIHQLGGFRIQATSAETARLLREQALALQKCGVFALVLECVPAKVAHEVTESLEIPTIGIGAGSGCSGQVLVWQDVLGLNPQFKPKFVRKYCDGHEVFTAALNRFAGDVKAGSFPSPNETYEA